MNKEDTAKQIRDYMLIHDLAQFKSLKQFDQRVYIWYTLKLYSGRFHVLINSLEGCIISYYASTPDNIEDEFKLTFMICGVFETIKRAKIKNKDSDETIIEQTSELVERVKTQKLL